jgi:hypothetical protein
VVRLRRILAAHVVRIGQLPLNALPANRKAKSVADKARSGLFERFP